MTEYFQNFATKGFMLTRIHVFLPSFAEIGKAEVTNACTRCSSQKDWYFAPFSGASAAMSPNVLYRITLSPFPITQPSFVEETHAKAFQTHYNIGVKPIFVGYGVWPTKKSPNESKRHRSFLRYWLMLLLLFPGHNVAKENGQFKSGTRYT